MSDNYERPLSGGDGGVLTADSSDGAQSSRCQETSHVGSKNDEHGEEKLDPKLSMQYKMEVLTFKLMMQYP